MADVVSATAALERIILVFNDWDHNIEWKKKIYSFME